MYRIHRALRIALTSLMVALILSGACALAPADASLPLAPREAQAQTAKQKIRAAYRKQAKKLARANTDSSRRFCNYRFANVCGSSTEELLVVTRANAGSGSYLHIYTYAGGKVKLLCKTGFYGDNWYHFYKKTKGFVMYCSGHGGEVYQYYQKRGKTYKLVLLQSRQSVRGGALENGPWSYMDGSGKKLAKATFAKRAKAMTKGSCKKVPSSWKWTLMEA